MKLRSFLPGIAAAAGLLLPVLRAADQPAASASPGDAFFSRFVEASGGEAAFRQQTSRLTKGRISIPALGADGNVEILQSAAGKTLQTFELGPGVAFTMGCDGAVTWMNMPGLGVVEMEGDQRKQFLDDADLFRMLNLSRRFTKTEVKAPQKLDSVECDVVVGTTKDGKIETFYFSRPDGLLRRWDHEILTQTESWAPGETWLEDYRAVGGVKLPFKIRQPKPESGAYEITITEIRLGVPTPDDKFRKPAA